jgi:hypothetical protein
LKNQILKNINFRLETFIQIFSLKKEIKKVICKINALLYINSANNAFNNIITSIQLKLFDSNDFDENLNKKLTAQKELQIILKEL